MHVCGFSLWTNLLCNNHADVMAYAGVVLTFAFIDLKREIDHCYDTDHSYSFPTRPVDLLQLR